MEIILTADIDKLGQAGEVVDVRDGYARNFLLPKNFAIPATAGAQKQIDNISRARQTKQIRDLEHANELKTAIDNLGAVVLEVKTADTGKLFGSVSSAQIAQALKTAGGPAVDKRSIKLVKGHIKATGTYPVEVSLHPGVVGRFTLEVKPCK